MAKIIVTGAAGRMGRRIITLANNPENQVELVGALERKNSPEIGRDAGETAGLGPIGVTIDRPGEASLSKADVVVDFTVPECTMDILPSAVKTGTGMVIGTTGFSNKELQAVRKYSQKIPCVLSPNMSVGVNLLYKLLAEAARVTGEDYDVEIMEIHHRNKKDAPSGTALRIAQVIASTLKRNLDEVGVFSRHGITGERKKNEIGIQTLRAGDVVGEHTVTFAGAGERIELVHRAHSRDNFARGALLAARWITGRAPGLYDMMDVLGLKS